MMTLSRDLQIGWISQIFRRFEGFYGRKFGDVWLGADIDNVKQEWANFLGPFRGYQIKWAIDKCATEIANPYEITLPKFYMFCKSAPRDGEPQEPKQIEHKISKEKKDMIIEGIKEIATPSKDFLYWARRPGSQLSMDAVKELSKRRTDFRLIFEKLVNDKFCTEDGKLI